jgi:hypothetical protein
MALTWLQPGTKGPEHTGWNTAAKVLRDPDAAAAVWTQSPTLGMGAVHAFGTPRTATLDLDDYPQAERVLGKQSIEVEAILATAVRSEGQPNRAKAWFSVPAGLELGWLKLQWPHPEVPTKQHTVFELRAGAVQDILPPTIHPLMRQPYRWYPGASPWDHGGFPELPATLIALWQTWAQRLAPMLELCPWAAPAEHHARATSSHGNGTHATEDAWDAVRAAIRARCSVERVLAKMGAERRGGYGKYLCPFHTESTPSFWIFDTDDGEQRWTCGHGTADVGRRTAKGFSVGDVIDLYAFRAGCSVGEATKRLATELGIPSPGGRLRWDGSVGGQRSTGGMTALPLPAIVVTNRPLRDILDEAHTHLVEANDPPTVFVRGGALVRARVDEYDRCSIEGLTGPALRNQMTASANYVRERVDKSTGVITHSHVVPPREVVEGLGARGQWQVPSLRGIVEAPTLRPDGSLLTRPGYDAPTALLYRPPADLVVPAIATAPSQADACTALAWLADVVVDFPFDSEASRANAYALIITQAIRPAIRDAVPLFLIDKPRAGTGATLLANLGALIATGRPATLTPLPTTEEEVGKTIVSLLLAGAGHPVFDNVERPIASASLAALITSIDYSGRMLGSNHMLSIPNLATWVATGNNVRLAGDMPRRVVPIRMDAELARPWTREQFTHPDLPAYVLAQRGELLAAILTLARAWYAADCPQPTVPTMGSFEAWARTVGGMLAFAGVDPFLGNLTQLWEENDEDGVQWEAFLGAWYTAFGDEPQTVAQAVVTIEDPEDLQGDLLRETLPDDLADAWHSEKQRSGFRKRLGKALARHIDGVYGRYRLKKAGTSRSGVVCWQVTHCPERP